MIKKFQCNIQICKYHGNKYIAALRQVRPRPIYKVRRIRLKVVWQSVCQALFISSVYLLMPLLTKGYSTFTKKFHWAGNHGKICAEHIGDAVRISVSGYRG